MRNARVHWYEGLFLLPQHFQAADRHWAEVIQTSEKWDHAYNYGLQTLEFSREALADHQFQVHALQARMRDGTLVSLRTGQEPDRLDLKGATGAPDRNSASLSEAFDQAAVVRVYLGIPNLKLGRANVASSPSATDTRYIESSVSLHEEGRSGDEQEIQIRELNVQLLLSTQDLSGYDVLPIAQIKRASENEAAPQLDPDYIPPMLCIGAWPGLGRDIVRAVHDVIGQKIEVLSQQISNRGIGLDSRDPGDLDRVMMLVQLNQAHARLSVLVAAQGVTPLTAYLELCGIAGQLSIFSEARRSNPLFFPTSSGESKRPSTSFATTSSSSATSSATAWACTCRSSRSGSIPIGNGSSASTRAISRSSSAATCWPAASWIGSWVARGRSSCCSPAGPKA
jgi:type VI secretion system protein ImpJ